MAGDWIKMRSELQTHPKVVRILSAMRPHDVQTKTDKFRVIGGLHAVWSVFDTHSSDGVLIGYTPDLLDHVIGWEGFAAALIGVDWLHFDGAQTLSLPEFDEHNGQSAKRRAEDQKRKRDARKSPQSVRNLSADDADKKRTKSGLDKREDINTPHTPQGGKSAISLNTFLADCKAKGEKPIPEGDTVFAYADETGIPLEFLRLHWLEFKERYAAPDAKRYKDWRSVHRKSVRGNWFRIWYIRGDECGLTTQGEQAKRHHGRDAA